MNPVLDNAIALRIVYLLQTPFTEFDAYKLGLIDDDGNVLKKKAEMSEKEQDSLSMLHRLVLKVKKMLTKLPGGDSRLKSLVASFLLIKECVEGSRKDIQFEDVDTLTKLVSDDEVLLFEEIASTAVGNVQGLDTEPVVKSKPKMVRRNEKYKYPKFKEFRDGSISNTSNN